MLLVIDIGNTNTVIGIFDNDGELIKDWRIRTEKDTTEDELSVLLTGLFAVADIAFGDIEKAVISSVVPTVERIYDAFCHKYLAISPTWVDARTATNITIDYANPAEVGADRIVNAAAAYEKYRTNMIVVDFGTAITFDLISNKGVYTGGVIAPGIGIAAEALFKHASKLPRIDLLKAPDTLIGHDTVSSIKSGMIFGFAGLVDGIVNRIQQTADTPYRVIATGGLASLIASVSETIEAVETNLTLEGLRIIGLNY
ncbi:MAG: type III pantothenate kinase [Thermodesulfobacteriota bacterium]|nr:type III pantothenate kinase [Thermodesulfobacteriota bacterium]